MTYLFVPFPTTLDDLEGYSPNAVLIKCNSTNICATFSTVLNDAARRAVPRRQLSFLSKWRHTSQLPHFTSQWPAIYVKANFYA